MKKSLIYTPTDSSTPTDPFGDGSGRSYFLFDSDSNSYDGNKSISSGTATRSTSVKKHGTASLDLTSNVWYSGNNIPSDFRITYSNAITVTFWVYINSQQNGSPINYNYDGNSRHSFNITSSGVTQLTNYNGSSYNTVHGATLSTGSWHFIANRIQGNGFNNHSTMTLDVDSTKYTTTSSSGSIGAWITRGIGRDANAGYFNGYMDTLRGFNRILTDAEVAYIRNNDPIT
jgi:hypothetical protein